MTRATIPEGARRPPATNVASLAHGGFTSCVLRRLGLIRDDEHDVRRQAIALTAFGGGTLAALSAIETVLGRPPPLLQDPAVHVRLLVAVPLLVFAENKLAERVDHALAEFVHGRFASSDEAMKRIVDSARRLLDSWWPELLLLGTAIVVSLSLWGSTGATGVVGEGTHVPAQLSATHAWYAIIGLPLFQLMLWRVTWHWFIWIRILFQISRLRLELVPTHPDLAGGIEHLSRPVIALGVALTAGSSVIASSWGGEIIAGHAELRDFVDSIALLVILTIAFALGPYMFFAGHLLRGHIRGLREYGELAHRYTLGFHRKWVEGSREHGELLGTSDIQSLADLGNSFEIVVRMRVVPFGTRLLYMVGAATLLPMVPLLLTEMSVRELLATLGGAVIGGGFG